MVNRRWVPSMIRLLTGLLLTTCLDKAYPARILFEDDFSSRNLESYWIFYGDAPPMLEDSMGLPSPSFKNNGDSMGGCGVISREVFQIETGFFVEADIYFTCQDRGTWVTARMGIVTPGYRSDDRTEFDYIIALLDLSYSGELDWHCPHRETVLSMNVYGGTEKLFDTEYLHQNQLMDEWHHFRMEINPDRTVSFSVDDSTWCVSRYAIPDTVEHVRITLGDRSSDWGIALHDNVRVGIR